MRFMKDGGKYRKSSVGGREGWLVVIEFAGVKGVM